MTTVMIMLIRLCWIMMIYFFDNDNCSAVVNYDDDDGETVDGDGRCWLC